MKRKLRVIPQGGQWAVRREGATVARTLHDSFEAARRSGITVARLERGAVTIHRANGQIAETWSFRQEGRRRRGLDASSVDGAPMRAAVGER